MNDRLHRREFLRRGAALGCFAAASSFASRRLLHAVAANEKLNIGVIGVAHRGRDNLLAVAHENIVALCDVDESYLSAVASEFPKAATYTDYRRMLERQDLDAVVVSTPDHHHAPASVMAMKLGKHVYCEKPLTHSVYEARIVAQTAAEMKVATQMGTQIHAGDNYRRVVEIVQAGAIGPIGEVHVWVGKGWGGGERPQETPPVPAGLHWDVWLGPAPERPYHPTYLPANWRRWWDFGNGTLGDMGCHYMDLPFWALGLGRPQTIEAQGAPQHAETAPLGTTVRYEFPARGDMPAVRLTWYDGDMTPKELLGHEVPGAGVLFVGERGQMFADYNTYRLWPESDFRDFRPPPPSIPASMGHHQEWIAACKTGSPTTCNFGYSGPLSEAVLLGSVAFRTGKKLEWDAEHLLAPNCPEAEPLLRRSYRDGWTL